MSAEFWAIIGVGAALFVVVADGVSRVLNRLNTLIRISNDIRLIAMNRNDLL
jgi:hypothetical protein